MTDSKPLFDRHRGPTQCSVLKDGNTLGELLCYEPCSSAEAAGAF